MARIDIVTISSDDDADHINIVGNADSALKSVPAYAKVCEDAAAATYSISDGSEDAQRRGSTSSSCTSVVFVSSRWLPTIVEGENLSCSTVEEEDRSCGYSPGVHRHQQQLFIRGNVDEILPQKNRPTAASLSTPAHASAGGRHMSVHGVHGEPLSDVNKDPLKPSSVEATANGRDQRVVTSPWLHGYFKVSRGLTPSSQRAVGM
ncbi:hypothetical protein M406DRAFT_320881 [Cryphonectria parasitica EP155]|uniref:Uncharacterized protein n=1 Tax=Cryphonectria parasitica (strain ATCC 38755 / EP155) TaxID=660469 RepID=A0A9P5CRE7_CRYP1|nr:uncharacterized protein M406DRAFT_320881 [Cryphonectria parasitica EP155]KAF3768484.1 hypothetical protein M406DRAFT_320881 [Cryphonectria parasitica EP155]